MKQCQSSQDGQLLQEADPDMIQKVLNACNWGKIHLGMSAECNIKDYWRVERMTFIEAIRDHIEKGRKVFLKPDPIDASKLLLSHLHANVTLNEDFDMYVEMVLTGGVWVVIHAHAHMTARLPQ